MTARFAPVSMLVDRFTAARTVMAALVIGVWLAPGLAAAQSSVATGAGVTVAAVSGGAGETAGRVGPQTAPSALDARLAGDEKRTRLVVDLSDEVTLDAFVLDEPDRVVIDLPRVDFKMDGQLGQTGRGLISRWRFGLLSAQRSRIVIDATGPVAIDKAFVLPAVDNQPARLVLDLVPTTRAAFRAEAQKPRVESFTTAALTPDGGPLKKGDRRTAPVPPVAKDKTRPVVVIDAGHGGIDPGTWSRFSNMVEKEVTLDVAKLLRDKLVKSGRYEVVMTRTEDVFIPLSDRVRIAREASADLLVSIHADAENVSSVRGATVYTLSDDASDQRAAELADKENRADALAGMATMPTSDAVGDILIDLTRRETDRFSHEFAAGLVSRLSAAGKAIRSNPHRSAGFRVLKAHDVPSILLELGFLSNREDEARMRSPQWRDQMTDVMTQAIDTYFAPRVAKESR